MKNIPKCYFEFRIYVPSDFDPLDIHRRLRLKPTILKLKNKKSIALNSRNWEEKLKEYIAKANEYESKSLELGFYKITTPTFEFNNLKSENDKFVKKLKTKIAKLNTIKKLYNATFVLALHVKIKNSRDLDMLDITYSLATTDLLAKIKGRIAFSIER